MGQRWQWTVGGLVVLLLAAIFVFPLVAKIVTIEGNEIGVLETWWGVQDEPLQPATYVLFPGFMKRVYKYDMSSQVYVMNDKPSTEEFAEGRETDSYLVQSSEGQDMNISMNVRWRLDPLHVVQIHKTVRENFQEKLMRPLLMRVVKDEATQKEAIEAYSGKGLVDLQQSIYKKLAGNESELLNRGIIVENFVIEHIKLDSEYIKEIKARQVAVQKELRNNQEQKAALAEALKAEAEAKADYNRQVVAAERDKQVQILAAEAKKEQDVLNAEAEKQKAVLAAEGEKEASVLQAEAILALGKAKAEAKKLELGAYSVEGSDNWVKVEVAGHMAEAFKNIKGYLPSDMQIFTLGNSFDKAIDAIVKPTVPQPAN